MSSDFATKSGRGGAGNFHSKQDIENGVTRNEDIEAQKDQEVGGPVAEAASQQQQRLSHMRNGRGGAGNFIDLSDAPVDSDMASTAAAAAKPEGQVEEKSLSGNPTSNTAAYRGRSGRGGVGNWAQSADLEDRRRQEVEEKIKGRVGEQVRRDVEMGLKPPPRAYASGADRVVE